MTFHQTRPPLTAIELSRRAAVLSTANLPQTDQKGEEPPVEILHSRPKRRAAIREHGSASDTRCKAKRCAGIQ